MRKIFAVVLVLFGFNSAWGESASLFELTSVWRDQENKEFQLQSLKGKKVIIGMIYTGCPHACPMTISKIIEIERGIKKGVDYRIVLASFDVKNDKPEKLKKQITLRNLNPQRWTLLSAAKDAQARELALVLGISYKDLGDGDFSHSNVLSLLDENGTIVEKLESLSADSEKFIEAINGK